MLECHECGDPITSVNHAWYEVIGWEHPRSQGGTNSVSLRKRTGVVVCESCMLVRQMQVKRGPVGDQLF